jgi:hypothetical protein
MEAKTRAERADALQAEFDALRSSLQSCIDQAQWKKAKKAINRMVDLEDEIATLRKFKTDEDFRLFLVRQCENGYH